MARLLEQFVSEPRQCAYLAAQTASLEYRIMLDVDQEELETLLARGWRRFGPAYFRPACEGCRACVPLRIPIEGFQLTRNQKRVLKKGEALRMRIGLPVVDRVRLELYRRWHQSRSDRRGWTDDQMDAERYFQEFAFPHPAVRELTFWDHHAPDPPRLVAVSIVDETPLALSAVYTYHDPAYERLSPGTLSILRQVEIAQRANKRWLYLGYRVNGCPSSEYKGRFGPHELLEGYPDEGEPIRWIPPGVEVAIDG